MNKGSIIILAAWKIQEKKFWLQEELEKLEFNVTILDIPNYNFENRIVKWRETLLWMDYLKLAWRGVWIAQKTESVVVSCHFLVGVLALLLSAPMLLKKRPPVIALNLIARNKGLFNKIVRGLVYRAAFSSDRLLLTVNFSELRDRYIKTFGIRPEIISILPDCWVPSYEVSLPSLNDEGFVFSGGEAARDWDTLLSVATACPEISFKIVARQMYWNHSRNVPSNVTIFFDTSEEDFYSMAASSRLVILPLVGQVTAGLIVLIKSIILGKMVIATATPATVPYYPSDCHDLLVPESDVETMIAKLKYYWITNENRTNKAIKLQSHVLKHFSPEAYATQISNLIKKFTIADGKLTNRESY